MIILVNFFCENILQRFERPGHFLVCGDERYEINSLCFWFLLLYIFKKVTCNHRRHFQSSLSVLQRPLSYELDEDDVEFLQTHAGDGLAANDLERALDLLEREWYARFERSLALTDRSVGYAWGGGGEAK